MSSTPIPPSTLTTSYFDTNGAIPTFGAIDTSFGPAIVSSINGSAKPYVRRPNIQSPNNMNKIYFTKKVLKETIKDYDVSANENVVRKRWEIPFSVDETEHVADLTVRIHKAMERQKIYTFWDVNMYTHTISAVQLITDTDEILHSKWP